MGPVSFGALNYGILAAYLAIIMGVGISATRNQKTGKDYFLAGRNMPWIIVGMSMFASMTSAVSYMGMPGTVAKEDLSILAGYFLSPITAPFILLFFYPLYRKLDVTTSYEYIFRRYGASARYGVSGLFLLARLGWLGAVIYAPALALSVITGINLYLAIFLMGFIATSYAVAGGLKAVVLTDAIQFIVLMLGAVLVAISLTRNIPGGASGIIAYAGQNHHLFNYRLSLFQSSVFAFGLSYFFMFMQDYGCDQVGVQRILSSKSFGGMIRAILFNSTTDVLMFSLLGFIGLGLFAYFQQQAIAGVGHDKFLPYYMIHALPNGISGLAIAGIFAAAICAASSGIHSMSTVSVNDFVRPLRRMPLSEAGSVKLGRIFTATIGLFGTAMAIYVSSIEQILKAANMLLGLFNGPILSLFLLGVLTTRVNFKGWLVGAGAAIVATLVIMNTPIDGHNLHWAFYMPCSTLISMTVGYLSSIVLPGARADINLTVWRIWEERRKDKT